MLSNMQISRRHSDGSVPRDRRLTLLQQQKIYKVKMADLSMVYDGHNAVSSIPLRLSIHSEIQCGSLQRQIVLHQPDWLEISGSATSVLSCIASAKSQRQMPSPSDVVAKMCNNFSKTNSTDKPISSQMFADSTGSVSSQAVKDDTPFRKISRKKSVPRHRCDRLNQSLTSVLRPSNYPFPKPDRRLSRSLPPHSSSGLSDDDVDAALFDEERPHLSSSGLDVSYSSSEVDDPAFSEDKLDGAVLDKTRLRRSLNNLDEMPWVPKGVDFSLTVEAYFYRQH
ncbi:hypothetical protein ACHAWO_011918 [Cyclotella atomus]|uniref:Uncharacterized protein n=1 Tax=Cyclotella atomus TaxID=382360 RepID=A0ABD3P8D1_9STRA